MGARLAVDINTTNDAVSVRLSGIVDEDNELLEISKQIAKPTVIINTADVDRINSCGVRDWVTWLSELYRRGLRVYFVECSPAIMSQVNLVDNFIGAGRILSFYAPYFCTNCDTDKVLLVDVQQTLQSLPFRSPVCRCDQCDYTMEFDDIEQSYFAFLANVVWQPLPEDVAQLVTQFSGNPPGKLRSRSPLSTRGTRGTASPPRLNTMTATSGTTPNSQDLRGLLTESLGMDADSLRAGRTTKVNKVLYLIIGLLAVAIGLLAFVVVRAM